MFIFSIAIFCDFTARFVSDQVGNPEERFSHNEAHLIFFHQHLRGNAERMEDSLIKFDCTRPHRFLVI